MSVVGYVLANAIGEILTIPATLDDELGPELLAQGWRIYREVLV